MAILIPTDIRNNSFGRRPDDFLRKYLMFLGVQVVFSISELLFEASKGVFDGIKVWGVRRKEFELASFAFDEIFEFLI